jgi:hypothetical protein
MALAPPLTSSSRHWLSWVLHKAAVMVTVLVETTVEQAPLRLAERRRAEEREAKRRPAVTQVGRVRPAAMMVLRRAERAASPWEAPVVRERSAAKTPIACR